MTLGNLSSKLGTGVAFLSKSISFSQVEKIAIKTSKYVKESLKNLSYKDEKGDISCLSPPSQGDFRYQEWTELV